MPIQPRHLYTAEEYLALERKSETKSEFFGGEIFAMTGASRAHNLIVANIIASLHGQLRKGPCEVYPGDMRVKVEQSGLYTYPDVTVACENPEFEDGRKDTLLTPVVIFEVLSKSTESYDRGRKFEQYRMVKSLVDYLLIAQDRVHIEYYTRQSDTSWRFSEIKKSDGTIRIASIECKLSVDSIFEKVHDIHL